MVSPWCLVPPQARDSVNSGPLLGQHPPGPKTPRTPDGGGAHEVVILPVRYPPGCRLQDSGMWIHPSQGPCLQSLLRSRSRARAGAFSALHISGGEPADDLLGRGGDTPSVRCQGPVGPRFRAIGPVDPLLVVRDNVSRGPEGAYFLRVPLYASYLRSRCPNQCIGVRAPGNRPADPRGRPAPESPILSAADRACGLPLGPSSGVLDGVASPGAALAAPVGPRRSGPVRRSLGCPSRRAVPASARPGPAVGAAPQRRQALPCSRFLRSRSQGATKTPFGSRLGQTGSVMAVDLCR
ncbi:hypothetical protein NDU88_002370 [Pleurodeles waltl]|uniref:Uncharacterized protein n=1 Tax=Pleurodeles waltl TaxID=8319 RepID=A0AAV7PBG2_PLEWA|nr:hypothetical protein NDU88_002370 [Pleurodeles waltl]